MRVSNVPWRAHPFGDHTNRVVILACGLHEYSGKPNVVYIRFVGDLPNNATLVP